MYNLSSQHIGSYLSDKETHDYLSYLNLLSIAELEDLQHQLYTTSAELKDFNIISRSLEDQIDLTNQVYNAFSSAA
jgi:hypothetical protein